MFVNRLFPSMSEVVKGKIEGKQKGREYGKEDVSRYGRLEGKEKILEIEGRSTATFWRNE